MKKIRSIIVLFLSFSICLVTGCLNGSLVWADNSVTQTSGIDVDVLENSKKQFILGQDQDELVSRFSQFGELVCLNIKVSGVVTLDALINASTGMVRNENGVSTISKNQSESDYYTDWFKLKIYLPKDAYYVNFNDGQGYIQIDKAMMTEDTYPKKNIEWVEVNKAKTEAKLLINSDNNVYYFYVGFYNQSKEILSQYFVNVSYDITIK